MIVVTGAAGFIGSAMIWRLNCDGRSDILAVDEAGRNDAGGPLPRLRYQQYLSKDAFLEMVLADALPEGIEAIIHMGACSSTAERNHVFLQANNIDYTRHLAEWCLKHHARYLYASSAATYGDGEQGFSDADELTPKLQPMNPYGWSKLKFDQWVLENGFADRFAGFRFFNVFGPNEYRKGPMVSGAYRMYHQIRETGSVSLFQSERPDYPDGGQQRDFVYSGDCVEVMLWFLQNPQANGIFNVGTGQARSWNDLANAVFAAMDLKPVIDYVPMPDHLRGSYQYHTEAELVKLRAAGYTRGFTSLEGAVDQYVRQHLESADPWLRPPDCPVE